MLTCSPISVLSIVTVPVNGARSSVSARLISACLQDRYGQLDIGRRRHDLCVPAAGQGFIQLSLGLAHQCICFGQLTGSVSVSAASCAWATSTAAAALATCVV